MDFMILEVDGSLSNPMAAASVAIWAAVLSALALVPACRSCPLLVRVATLALAIALAADTRMAQHRVGSFLYSVLAWRVIDVGFWYGPPTWIAPAVATAVGVTGWVMDRRRAGVRAKAEIIRGGC